MQDGSGRWSWLVAGVLLAAPAGAARAAVPPGGKSILVNPLNEYAKGSENRHGSVRVVAVNGPGFQRALEVESKVRGHDWDYQVYWHFGAPIKKGDVLLVRFWARTLHTADESGQSLITVRIEVPNLWRLPDRRKRFLEPLTRSLLLASGPRWREFFLRAQAPCDLKPDGVFIALRCGRQIQRVQFGGIDVRDYGRSLALSALPVTRYTYAGRGLNAPWRRAAAERIQRLRTGDITLRVVDATGRPVADAAIRVELERHAFQFGAAFTAWKVLPDFNPDYRRYRQRILENFSSCSFVNALKWHPWVGDWGARMRPAVTLRALHWVQQQGLPFRGHCLVWPRKQHVSNALRRMLEAPHPDPDAIERKIIDHIRDICPATGFWMEEWDVLNESIPCHDVQDICGDRVMVDWFKETRRLLPTVRLALNEYSILASLQDTAKISKHEARIRYLLENGAPLDVLGMQSHMGAFPPSPMRVLAVLKRFSQFHLPIRTTEYTLKSDDPELAYDFTRDFYTVMFSWPLVIGIQMWGFNQMYDARGKLTPIGRAYRDLVWKKWRTRANGRTDAGGAFAFRGFFGRYSAKIEAGGHEYARTFDLPKAPGRHEVRLVLK